jgi:hypothetical protein
MGISLVGFDPIDLAKKGCNRCGSKTVAWKASKEGKWYLIEAFDFDGEIRANYRDFHSGYCNKPELHEVKQRQISVELGIEQEEKLTLRVEQEERQAAEESLFWLELHDLCKESPEGAYAMIEGKEREIKHVLAGVTMDHMDDYLKSTARAKRLRTEIDFMKAALGLVTA